MGVETIVEAIASEASAQIADIRADRDRRVAAIVEDARNRADAERRRWAASRDEEAERKRSGIVNRARLEADRCLADLREALFQSALARLEELLGELTTQPRYERVLEALYQEAVVVVPDTDAAVLVRSEDRDLAERLIADRAAAGTVEATLSCIGGLDVEADDGRCVRNTLDSRLRQSEGSLRGLAVATIPEFAGSGMAP